MSSTAQRWRHWLRVAGRTAGEIFYGMTTFGWARDLKRGRAESESLFLLIAFGDLVGLPILPPYYSLRLLPLVMPALKRWKHGLLRERDWTDLIGLIEGAE
jgi:hypothetical protein